MARICGISTDYQFDRFPKGDASATGKWIKLQIVKQPTTQKEDLLK